MGKPADTSPIVSGGRRRLRLALAMFVIGTAAAAAVPVTGAPATPPARARVAAVSDDWPEPMHDLSRTNASSDTTISAATASLLKPLWTFKAQGTIVPAPIVTGGVAYFSSWDGNEYALNAKTGSLLWKTYMGVLSANPICIPPKAGPSTPSVLVGDTVLAGGADGYFYALDASTGAVEWKVWTWGTSPPGVYDGHFNYSPALVIGNYAYIGVASLGDCPLIQGQMVKVDLTTHQVVQTLDFVPDGFVGGGTWTEPAYDATDGRIYVSTATQNAPGEIFAQALAAIDPTTTQIVDNWTLPAAEAIQDSDFGTSPTLYTTAAGEPMLASINKNGIDYALDRDDLAAGPVWRQYIALGGECPTCDDGSVSSQAVGGGALFAAGGRGAIAGGVSAGTVRALNPASGAYLWQRAVAGDVIGALTYDNGMVLVPAGSVFEILEAKTGTVLYSYDTGSQIYAGISVADGVVYVTNTAGEVLAFALPAHSVGLAKDPNCPSGFSCQGIGKPAPAGHEVAAASAKLAISTRGSGVGGKADNFRLISRPTRGSDEVVAQITSQPSSSGSQAGVMIRQRNDPGSPYYALLEQPGHRLVVEYRAAFGSATTVLQTTTGPKLPLYLMVQRRGDVLTAATSADGKRFVLVPGSDATVPMPARSLGGMAVSAGKRGIAVTAAVAAVRVGAPTTTLAAYPSAHACPATYRCADIGNPTLVGDQRLAHGSLTLSAGGFDIWASSDQFHFVWRRLQGDAAVSARVENETDPSPDTKAGVMLRAGTGPLAPWYAVFVTPGVGVQVQYRDETGDISTQVADPAGTAPLFVRVTRSGDVFTAYTSPDGDNWTAIGASAVPLVLMSGRLLGGLALCSHDGSSPATATFTNIAIG
jgi:outer membrane protein assembly factor BamB